MIANQAVVFTKPRKVVLQKRPQQKPGPGELLIRTRKTLISTGTELTILSGDFPKGSAWAGYGKYPFTAGYSNVGEVVGVGPGVDESWVGRRVASGGAHMALVTKKKEEVYPIPDGVPDEQAVFFSLAYIVMNGVRRSKAGWGDAVVLYGLGLLGQLAARFCALCGARPVIGVDVAQERIAMLPDMPFVTGLNAKKGNIKGSIEKLTNGRMADIVFEITGSQDLITKEFEVLKPQGRFVLLSSPRGETQFDFHDFCNFPSYQIIGAHVCSHPEYETPDNPWTRARNVELFFKHIADEDIDIASLITHQEPATCAPEVFMDLLSDRSQAMGVILDWK